MTGWRKRQVADMAREAGIDAEKDTLCRYEGWVKPLERFAELVRADEREACAKVVESHGPFLANGAMLAEAIRARGDKHE